VFLFLFCLLGVRPAASGEIPPGRYVLQLLERAKEMELYSIDPSVNDDKHGFHDYKVLGKTTIKDAATLKVLVAAFESGIEKAKVEKFEPRHGVRFKLSTTTIDLLLCSPTKVYYNDKKGTSFNISSSPQAAFDNVLKAAGVQVAKPVEK
jgi:hypothetical protein